MFFAWFIGIALCGWFDYFSVDNRPNAACIVIRCFHVCMIPLFPVEALVIFDPSPSLVACFGKARCRSFRSRCNKFLWKGFLWAWLRFLTFGLISCWHPQCSDTSEIMEAVGILASNNNNNNQNGNGNTADNRDSYTTGDDNNNDTNRRQASSANEAPNNAGTSVTVTDNKEQYYNSFTPSDNNTDNRTATV